MESHYGLPDARLFTDALLASIVPTVTTFQNGQIELATGLMTADLSSQRGAFTWIQEKDKNLDFASAVWSTRSQTSQSSPDSLNLEILSEVRCSICGGLMMEEKESSNWESPYKLTNVVYVTPFCLYCVRRAEKDPQYWLENLPHLFKREARPSLRLIHGSGNGEPGPQRKGHLHFVK